MLFQNCNYIILIRAQTLQFSKGPGHLRGKYGESKHTETES